MSQPVLENGTMAGKNESGAYIREWMDSVGLKQADLVKKLDWPKAKAFAIWHGEQRYNEDILIDVGSLVNAEPFELLMPPATAHKLRRLRGIIDDALGPQPVSAAEPPAPAPVPIRRRKAS